MNWMEPPGSAEMSQIANNLLGRVGVPALEWIHGVSAGAIRVLASGMFNSRGVCTL